ncbi:MAG: DNA mismatch repair protein MutS [Oscillospiraceae bacterium]
MPELTPMMRQYMSIKEKHSDCILFFRLGDFYEMFEDDARTVSKELDLVLTTRDRNKEDPDERVPMCGVPYHSSEAYIARLIAKGYKVAICEQMEDPATAKGLVERDIVRIVTPGTLIDSSMLEDGKSNYLAAVYLDAAGAAVCFADISTGEICARSFPPKEVSGILNELARFSPSEAVLNQSAAADAGIKQLLGNKLGCLFETQEERFDYMQSAMRICEQFSVKSLDELGIGSEPQAVSAIGALLSYIIDTQKTDLSHINKLDFYSDGRYMELDIQTIRNLELLYSLRAQEKKGSLLWAMDRTRTPMGSRLIRSWVSRPLLSPAAINRRLAAVNELYEDNVSRPELILTLKGIGDMERIIGKVVYGTANCRDLTALKLSIDLLPQLQELLGGMSSPLISEIKNMDMLEDIRRMISDAVCDEPPFSVREGGMIREGFNEEVDHLRSLLGGSQQALADIEAREKARTGKKLKVSYNKVFGYYIEIPRSQSADVPPDYIRKQTLVNGERFITEELKNLETELLTAKERLTELEYQLFTKLRLDVAAQVLRVQATAALVAQLDVLCSFSDSAVSAGWCRPEITADGVIDIKDGRHPVVELMQKDSLFVPNDTYLDCSGASTAIITGPNMAGKSTYMRQTALIVLMAQIGSFVPARSASIGIVDRVFTRIGASDDLSAGKSTFMVEMSEVAQILKEATSRSLLILDEIGRGTSTYDGMAIARAVVEFCADKKKLGAKTMFATHYHELTALEDSIPGVKNYNISAKKRGGDIIFLRKIIPGGADDSYGIEVAHLAGVPENVIRRAKAILSEIISEAPGTPAAVKAKPDSGQVSLESMAGSDICGILRTTDINTMTPLEALNLLFELKKKVT